MKRFWPWLCLVLMIVVVIVIYVKYPGTDNRPRMIISDESVGAYSQINNSVAGVGSADRMYGVLVQLGAYNDIHPWRFSSIKFFNGETELPSRELKSGEFEWLNIVPSAPGNDPNVHSEHLGRLYDDGTTDEGDPSHPRVCYPVEQCAERAGCICDPNDTANQARDPNGKVILDPGGNPVIVCNASDYVADWVDGPGSCFRRRRLHRRLETKAVITFWHSKTGYEMKVTGGVDPTEAHPVGHTKSEFIFLEDVEIRAYDRDHKEIWASPLRTGEFTRIEIKKDDGGTDEGTHEDPLWPRP